jgi:hypothetical protein
MTWLIDNSGIVWRRAAHPITQWDAACDPVEFAVLDLGFIHLRPLNSGLTVSFNPSRVGRKTMISAFYVIAGEQPRRIALSCGGKCPDLEIFGTLAKAFRRIEELIDSHPTPIPVVSRKRWSLDRLPKHVAEPIKVPLRAWCDMAGRLTPGRLANLRIAALKDLLVVRNPRRTGGLVYDHWGESFDFLGPRWTYIACGKNVEEQPFPELGQRSASQFRRTLADGRPRVDEIDIALARSGVTILRRRYARLLLPWSEPGGDQYVTVLRFDQNIPTT